MTTHLSSAPHTVDRSKQRTFARSVWTSGTQGEDGRSGRAPGSQRLLFGGHLGACSLHRIENKSCIMEMSPSFSVWLIQSDATKEEGGSGGGWKGNWEGWSNVEDWSLCRRWACANPSWPWVLSSVYDTNMKNIPKKRDHRRFPDSF